MAVAGESIHQKFANWNKERLEALDRRREERKKNAENTSDMAEIFLSSFNKEKSQISSVMAATSAEMSKSDLIEKFDLCSVKLQSLQKYVSDSARFLPSYDVRRAQDIVAQLRTDISSKREELLPKPKFSFTSRTKIADKKESTSHATGDQQTFCVNFESSVGFVNRIGEELVLTASECNGRDVILNNLVDCTVKIFASPSTLQLRNILNSEVYVGPVSRAVYAYECIDSLFYLACQQLRVHSTSSCKFHVLVTSKAIIEDCDGVGFGMYKLRYPGIDEHFQYSGLDASRNNFRMIDDFNWLKLNEPSPNWYEIWEAEEIILH